MTKKSNINEFISKAILVHGNNYNYDQSVYTNCKTKLEINCKLHGNFLQRPNDHLMGIGCPTCGGKIKKTKDQFINDAIQVHNNKYSYTKIEYINDNIPVTITCHKHGDYTQTPNSHLQGRGCAECYNNRRGETLFSSQKQFIEKAITIHENKYSYNDSNYINSKTKIIVTCSSHGGFSVTPNNHIQGYGCPKCKTSKGQNKVRQWLKDHNIKFHEEHSFDTCINPKTNKKLKFDFFLPDNNICIEYDGEHHFTPISFRGSSNIDAGLRFKKILYRDFIKESFCKEKKIKLMHIPFTFIKNIPQLLNDTLTT